MQVATRSIRSDPQTPSSRVQPPEMLSSMVLRHVAVSDLKGGLQIGQTQSNDRYCRALLVQNQQSSKVEITTWDEQNVRAGEVIMTLLRPRRGQQFHQVPRFFSVIQRQHFLHTVACTRGFLWGC